MNPVIPVDVRKVSNNSMDLPSSKIPRPKKPILQRSSSFILNTEATNAFTNGLTTPRRRSVESKFRPRSHTFNSLCSYGSVTSLSSLDSNLHEVQKKRVKNQFHCDLHRDTIEEYLTPTQRLHKEISQLKDLLRKRNETIALKSLEIDELTKKLMLSNSPSVSPISSSKTSDSGHFENIQENSVDAFSETNDESKRENLPDPKFLCVQLHASNHRICELEAEIANLKKENEEKEHNHQQIYLQMYKKGEEAARFKHADEVLEFAHQAPQRVCVPELLRQLHLTEHELNQVKMFYRSDTYHYKQDEMTDAEVTLHLLKDAIYYYLTDKDSKQHLAVIENLVGFNDLERKQIQKTVSRGRHY